MKRLLAIFLALATCALPLAAGAAPTTPDTPMDMKHITLTVNGRTLDVQLVDNASTRALVQELEKGDIQLAMEDYGNFEKVGQLPRSFPRCDKPIDTEPGDVILYQGRMLCLYYAHNSWNFTRLGKIDIPADELKKLLGKGGVTVTLSLPKN